MSNPPAPGLLRRLDETGVPLLLARLVVGGMFVWMGFNKIAEPAEFLKLIRLYNIVPEGMPWLLNSMAALLPWLEVFCGLLLLAGIAVRGVFLIVLVLLTVFTAAIISRAMGIYHAGDIAICAIKFDCGCGSGEVYICRKVPENVGLWLLSLIGLVSSSRRFCLWRNLIPAERSPWRMEGY